MSRVLTIELPADVVAGIAGTGAGWEAAWVAAGLLAPALEAAQRAHLAGGQGNELVADADLLVDGSTAFWRWTFLARDSGDLWLVVSHPVLPTGTAFDPDFDEEISGEATGELRAALASVHLGLTTQPVVLREVDLPQ